MSTQTGSEDFSPAEQAYFSSKGSDTAALEAELSQEPQNEALGGVQGSSGTQGATSADAQKTASEGEDEDDGEAVVVLGKDGKPRGTNGRYVPHQALHKERERRKGVETELQTVRERQARADERLAVLNEILSQADAPAPGKQADPAADTAPPDPIADPIGALNHALAKIKDMERQQQEGVKRQSEVESERALRNAYQNDAIRYVQEQPEFADAYRFLIDGRHRELEAMGMADANARNQFIANEERGIVAQAIQGRMSPSQMLHKLAIARGFSPKPQQQQPDPAQKIEQIAKGQRAAGASLSGAGGMSGEGLTAASLADMDEAEFAATVARLGKAKVRQLMGG